jgi:asparagine synthase (glutamine-hydrolysing)
VCGICGVWRSGGCDPTALSRDVRTMTDSISYRGPDGDGHWQDADVGIALGHRRLAIIDLSPTGFQPMTSADGRMVLTYNGELYNREEIARELAIPFRGSSDTEVLLEAIVRFGIEGALQRANGLFAFAVFDRRERRLHLARDRLGIKPLYWTFQDGVFAFASELKALRQLPGLNFELDTGALAAYLQYAYVPAPRTIYRDVAKLLPGHRLEIANGRATTFMWWDLAAVASDGQDQPDWRSEVEIVADLHDLLADAAARQMVSDVPLGAFLSGGIDSSIVVALMQKASTRPVKTFSIGFGEQAFNEADDARAVARHLGTDHTELVLSASDAMALIPELPAIYDEPFADSSQLPTILVSRLARRHVTVALSGDGGDELFGGYVRHQAIERLWRATRPFPSGLRRFASQAIGLMSADAWDAVLAPLPKRFKPAQAGDKIVKAAALVGADTPIAMYRCLVSQADSGDPLVPGAIAVPDPHAPFAASVRGLDTTAALRLLDMASYLPDDILTKVDRASMAVGLEARVPLLDHRVVEFAWRLPSSVLIAGGVGKRPLRAVLDRYVPRHLVDRPKMGFGIPLAAWLRGPLRTWAEELLSPASLAHGLFDPAAIRRCFDDTVSGRHNRQHVLWALLQFQAWRRHAV